MEPALAQLAKGLAEGLAGARLTHGAITTYGTPRRLAVRAEAVATRSPDSVRQALGPSVKAAFGPDGAPTRAALKFAESQGTTVDGLRRMETPKGTYLAAERSESGQPASALLPPLLHALIHALTFKKGMRWGDVEQSFARPVQWLLALHGTEVVPVVFGDVQSGRLTRGHRFLAPEPISLGHPREYLPPLERAHVIADVANRKERIRAGVESLAHGGRGPGARRRGAARPGDRAGGMAEPGAGSFEARHLDLPPEVLVQEMRSHQRYFSLVDAQGGWSRASWPSPGRRCATPALSRRGYERVLRARLTDGRFFFDEDRKVPLAERVPALERVVWQGKLGSYADKVARIRPLAAQPGQRRRAGQALLGVGRPRSAPGQGRPDHRDGGGVSRAAGHHGPGVRPRLG